MRRTPIPPRAERSLGPWEIGLLVLAFGVATIYLMIGARVPEILDNDGAYYYGVARHIALTGRFEEPIVWHFIRPPATILHAPFDYWGCLTSLLLIPGLRVFGASPHTAFITMSLISALSVLAFWYLVCVALPLRHRAAQALGLVFFAFSPAMVRYRFQPESTAIAELFVVLALVALWCRRPALVVVSGFCVLLARGDGVVLFGLLSAAALAQAWRHGAPGGVIASVVGCVAAYAVWSLLSFGTLTPPGPHVVPFLPDYNVYDFGLTPDRSWRHLLGWLGWDYVEGRLRLGLDALRGVGLTPAGDLWLLFGAVPAFTLLRSQSRVGALVPLLGFGAYFAVAWIAGPGFAPWRTPCTFTPLIVLAGAIGLDAVLDGLGPGAANGWPGRLGMLIVAAVVVWSGVEFFASVRAVRASKRPVGSELARLDEVLQGEPVASNAPWYVIAYTQSPAVSIPDNGEAAIAAVLERYHVRWMVIFRDALPRLGPESAQVVQPLLAGSRTSVDGAALTRMSVAAPQVVFRVERESRRESRARRGSRASS